MATKKTATKKTAKKSKKAKKFVYCVMNMLNGESALFSYRPSKAEIYEFGREEWSECDWEDNREIDDNIAVFKQDIVA